MAIYSLHHSPIGKSTQGRPYTGRAHVDYITRRGAMSRLEGARLPVSKKGAMDFFMVAEDRSRKNGRVMDKVMVALPQELDAEQRAELVRAFAEDVTKGRAPWLAAFHDKGKDGANPHCHLVLHDRDPDTGRRVMGMSEKGSTELLRTLWEDHANRALERAGKSERIDHRTLEAQGIDRPATIHEGPRSQHVRRRGRRPDSRATDVRNGRGARSRSRRVDYPAIDRGRTRGEYNQELRRLESEREHWAMIDADQQARELEALKAIHHPPASVQVGLLGWQDAGPEPFGEPHASAMAIEPRAFAQRTVDVPLPAPRLAALETGDKPPPQKETFRTDENRGADLLQTQLQPTGYVERHDESIDIETDNYKGDLMDNVDEILARHQKDVDDAAYRNNIAQRRLADVMIASFRDPDQARKRMDKFCKTHTRAELYDYLRDWIDNDRTIRSQKPGSLFSREGYLPGAGARRRQADEARKVLPDALKEADGTAATEQQARRTLSDAQQRYGRPQSLNPGDAPSGVSPDGSPGGKKAVGPAERAAPGRQNESLARSGPGLGQDQPQHGPTSRPPRFSEVERGKPEQPIAFRQPSSTQKAPQLSARLKPRPKVGQASESRPGQPEQPAARQGPAANRPTDQEQHRSRAADRPDADRGGTPSIGHSSSEPARLASPVEPAIAPQKHGSAPEQQDGHKAEEAARPNRSAPGRAAGAPHRSPATEGQQRELPQHEPVPARRKEDKMPAEKVEDKDHQAGRGPQAAGAQAGQATKAPEQRSDDRQKHLDRMKQMREEDKERGR